MSSKPLLVYWEQIRGLCEHIRYMLALAGVDYDEKLYSMHYNPDTKECNWNDWVEDKYKLGMDFPNLPYYVDGDVKLTEGLVILKYLGEKYGFKPEGADLEWKIKMAIMNLNDIRMILHNISCLEGFEENGHLLKFMLAYKPEAVSRFLGEKQWLFGDKVTYVDCFAYEVLDQVYLFDSEVFGQYPNLVSYMERFRKLPEIEKYMESGKFKRWPIYPPSFYFGFHNPPNELLKQ